MSAVLDARALVQSYPVMDDLWTAAKTVGIIAAMVLIFVGGPIWGASGSLRHAWHAIKQYVVIMGALVVIGGGLGLLAALAG